MAKDLPIYKITIDPQYAEDGEDLGIEQIAFTNMPAIKVKGMAFNSEVKVMKYADDLKYRIVAPAMIPMQIYRCDEDGFEYEVEFSVSEIESIHGKFMQDMRNKDLFNLEHDQSKTVPAYILESWIVDNPKQDKAYSTYGIEVPTGTEPLVHGLSFIGPRQSASCTYLPELVLVLCFCLVQRYDH